MAAEKPSCFVVNLSDKAKDPGALRRGPWFSLSKILFDKAEAILHF